MKETILNNILFFLKQTLLKPAYTTKKWTVDYGSWSSGRFKSFWFKGEAMEFAKKRRAQRRALFVHIKNEITGKKIKIRDNPDDVEPPEPPKPVRYKVIEDKTKTLGDLPSCVTFY